MKPPAESFDDRFWELWYENQSEWQASLAWLPHKRPLQIAEEFLMCLQECSQKNDLRVLELGTFSGFQKRFWETLLSAKHVGVDNNPKAKADIFGDSKSEETVKAVKKFLGGLPPNVIFIDADHSYSSVKGDYEFWSEQVSEDGIILLHDIVSEEGVSKFWNELKTRANLICYEILAKGAEVCGIGVVKREIQG